MRKTTIKNNIWVIIQITLEFTVIKDLEHNKNEIFSIIYYFM